MLPDAGANRRGRYSHERRLIQSLLAAIAVAARCCRPPVDALCRGPRGGRNSARLAGRAGGATLALKQYPGGRTIRATG